MNYLKNLFSLVLLSCMLSSLSAQVQWINTSVGTNTSSAIGHNTEAPGLRTLAAGFYSRAEGHYSFALGTRTLTQGNHSMALGLDVRATNRMAVTIGEGAYNPSSGVITPLNNNTQSSLMVGFKSDIPTLFVGPANGVGTVGNVGIGTDLPSGLLEVNRADNPDIILSRNNSALQMGVASTAGTFSSLTDPGDIVFKGTGSWRRMIFSTDANHLSNKEFLFANTNGAMVKLSDDGEFKLYDASGPADYMEFDTKWGGNFYWNFNSPSQGSVQRLHIGYVSNYSANNQPDRILEAVIIGTKEAAQLGQTTDLSVHGEIKSCSMKTQEITVEDMGWCDYVFEKDYPLMPLSEVASFIEQNKHLPNIPSAATVAKNGRDLGDMQKKMMEKIEELTLYLIEQNQRLGALEDENEELKSRLSNQTTH